MTAIETYLPLLQFVAFVGGWAVCMVTGLLFVSMTGRS